MVLSFQGCKCTELKALPAFQRKESCCFYTICLFMKRRQQISHSGIHCILTAVLPPNHRCGLVLCYCPGNIRKEAASSNKRMHMCIPAATCSNWWKVFEIVKLIAFCFFRWIRGCVFVLALTLFCLLSAVTQNTVHNTVNKHLPCSPPSYIFPLAPSVEVMGGFLNMYVASLCFMSSWCEQRHAWHCILMALLPHFCRRKRKQTLHTQVDSTTGYRYRHSMP